MDVTNLVLNLKSKISNTTADQQMVAKAIELLELGAVDSVGSFSQLPAASTTAGAIFYVYYDGLYWSNGTYWIAIAQQAVELWGWGRNSVGEVGDATLVSRLSPVIVTGGISDWCQVSNGGGVATSSHVLAIRRDGTAWAWGVGTSGRLGDNSATNKSSPILVAGGFIDWCQMSAGGAHSHGLRTNGTIWAWGANGDGQLGDNTGTTASKSSPVLIAGGFTDWCQVSAGSSHSLGIRTNGTAWGWGRNTCGQLADNTIVNKSSPVTVLGGFTDWCQVSAGNYHSLGLRTNGTLWSWGGNIGFCSALYGTLGDNTVVNKSSPVSVVGGFTDWCQISAGSFNSMGVRANGTLWTWGAGNLGDNTTTAKSSPVSVAGGFTDWCQVSASRNGAAAVRTNGSIWTWGSNCSLSAGSLGDGTLIARSSPVSVVGEISNWSSVSAGAGSVTAIRKYNT